MLILNRPALFLAPNRDMPVEYPSSFVQNLTMKFIPNFSEDVAIQSIPTIEICGLLGYYTASCGNCLPTFTGQDSES